MPKLIQIREEVTACRECVHRQTRWEGVLQYSRCTKVKKRREMASEGASMSERDPRIEPRPGDVLRKGDREIMVHFVERGQVYFDRTCDFGFSGARITIEQFREHAQEADRVEVIGGPKNRRWFDGPDLMQWKTMVAHGDYTLPFWCFPWGGLFTTMEEFARIMHAVMTPEDRR